MTYKAPLTRAEVESQITLAPVEGIHDADYEVTLKSTGAVIGKVYRRIHHPKVNYPGTRIRKTFKGSPKWFAELPYALQASGPRLHRLDCDTRWKAVRLLLRRQ